jgi:hypothetical protein
MRLSQRLNSKGGATVLGGLAFWVMAWALDMWAHVQTFGIGTGDHEHGGTALLRVNIPLTGTPLIVFGLALLIGSDALMKRGGVPKMFASLFLMHDGLFHAFAFNDHLGNLTSAAFFAFVAPLQIAVGVALPFMPRRFDGLMLFGTFGLIALYAVSRSASFPPLGWPEPVEALDVFSKFVEVLFILALIAVMRGERPRGATPAPAKAAEPAGDG